MCMYVCGFVYVGHKWDFMKSIDRPHCYTREQKEWKTGCGGGTYVFLLTPTHRNPSTSLARCFRRCCSGSSLFVRLYMQIEGKKQYILNGDWILVFFSSFVVSASYPGNAKQGFSLLFLPPLFLQSFQLLQELQLRARVIGLTVTPIILTTENRVRQDCGTHWFIQVNMKQH